MENLRASALRLVAYPVKHGERTPKKPCFDIIAGITGKWKLKKKIFGRFLII